MEHCFSDGEGTRACSRYRYILNKVRLISTQLWFCNRSLWEGLGSFLYWSCPRWEAESRRGIINSSPILSQCVEFTLDERVASPPLRDGGWILTMVCVYAPNSSLVLIRFGVVATGDWKCPYWRLHLMGEFNDHMSNDSEAWKNVNFAVADRGCEGTRESVPTTGRSHSSVG